MKNLFGQEPYALRGEADVRLAALEARLVTAETELATIDSGAWAVWTPVVSQSNTPAQTINWARYVRAGRLITAHFSVTLTAAGTAANRIVLSGLPAAAADAAAIGGSFRYFDAGTTNRAGTISGLSTTTARFFYDGFGSDMGLGDFAIANTDLISGVLILEAAS